jgi:1-acyl-sn-glycerol-3-phosphate acyltransferase
MAYKWLRIQGFLGNAIYFPQGIFTGFTFKFLFRYRIENHNELRKKYRELMSEGQPLLICSNHLTFIDSIIIIWAFGSTPWYFLNYNYLTWNLPAAQYSRDSLFIKIFCYLSKCIFIERSGAKSQITKMLALTTYLLQKNQVLTIFPEGMRGRTGHFNGERLKMGAGKIAASVNNCRVLCVYVRSHKQKTYSKFPPRGSVFFFETELLEFGQAPKTAETIIDLVGKSITRMQENYINRSFC